MGVIGRLARLAVPLSFFGTAVGCTVLVKDYYSGARYSGQARIDGKTVIITGANTGIGKETAKDLAARGGRVILACRDTNKGEQAAEEIRQSTDNKNVFVRQLDLSSLQSVRTFADNVVKDEQNIDILINNAGVMCCPQWKTVDGFEMQFGVNHLGHFFLTNLLLDKLKDSAPSRIITVSSVSHSKGEIDLDDLNSERQYSRTQAYANSKLANVLFTQELSKRLKGTGVTANVLHPGVVKTEIGRHTGMHNSGFTMAVLGPLFWLFVKTPQQGAQTTIYCAVDEKLQTVSGKYFVDCQQKKCAAMNDDDETARRLWEVSQVMVGQCKTDTNNNTKMPS